MLNYNIKIKLFTICLILFFSISIGWGQNDPTQVQEGIYYSFHVGSAHPLGELDTLSDANINVQVDFGYRMNEQLKCKLMVGLNQFTAEYTAAIDNPRWINANLDIQLVFPTISGRWYYLLAGPGNYWPKSGSAKLGFNVGGGSQIPIAGPFSLEFGLDFHQVLTKPPTRFLTLQLGVIYR